MSEKPHTDTDEFDPLAESIKRADTGKQIYEQFMERDAEAGLSPEEHSEAYQQMADYLKSRPYKDRNGRLHDPITGGFISGEEAGVFYTPGSSEEKDGEEVDEYKSMSLSSLAALSAEAEFHNDRTTMLSVDDEIQQRIIEMDLKDELVERDGSTRENSERSMVLEHVMKLREKYLEKMKKDAESIEDGDLIDDASEAAQRILKDPEGQDSEKKDDGSESEPITKKDPPAETDPQPETETEPDEEGSEPTPEQDSDDREPSYEISETSREALDVSRNKYAELSATRRGETLNKSSAELEAAKHDYEAVLKQVNEELLGALTSGEMPPEQARMIILDSSLAENQKLMQLIADKRIEMSSNKRLSKFYDWFGKQQGFKGRLKKMAALTLVTAPLGVAAGVAGVVMLGPVTGALAAGAMARGIARGLASGKINKEAGAKSLAEQEGSEDVIEVSQAINQWMIDNPGSTPPAELITEVSESTTRERVSENRRRTAKMATVGAVVGLVSGFAAHWLSSSHAPDASSTPKPTGPQGNIPSPTPPTTAPEIPFLPGDSIPTGTFKYPWSWAKSTFGGNEATPMLEKLVQRAHDAGIDAKWNPNPGGVRYIEVNGASDAQSVINILKQFVQPGELPPK